MQKSQKQDINAEKASPVKDNHQPFERSPYAPGVQEGTHTSGQGKPK